MSTPTQKLPAGYATVQFGIPSLTESTTLIGAAVITALSYKNDLELIPIEGHSGFVAGYTEMKAASAGSGGTKYDTEECTIACVSGTHASKTWPEPGDVITISGATGRAAAVNGDWKIVGINDSYARKQEASVGYNLKRWCDVDLTP